MEPLLQLSDGEIRGTIRTNTNDEPFYSFTCIPYGKAPVGNLRFKAPQPVAPWEGIKDATKEENVCFQKSYNTQHFVGSEDCLSLHVFTKQLANDDNSLKPVMVFIHGGGFMMGTHETNMYGPEYLMTEDIVLVIITYRVGFLGFLKFNDPALDVPGNAGLKDQVLALKWVRKNIEMFNGDPDNVTIFGSSAGAASVEYLVLSPTASGLFHKAIMQSGSTLNPWTRGYFKHADLADFLGYPRISEKELLEILTAMSIERLIETQYRYIESKQLPGGFGLVSPVVEEPNPTAFLTEEPVDIIQSGQYNAVPVIMGFNDQEGDLLLLFERMAKAENKDVSFQYKIEKMLPHETNLEDAVQVKTIVDTLKNFYGHDDIRENRIQYATDAYFVAGIITSARNQAKVSKNPVYLYRFSLDTELNLIKKMANLDTPGACHGDDLGYLFKSISQPKMNATTKIIQQRLLSLWTNFAKYGNPTPDGNDLNIKWQPIENDKLNYLEIAKELKMRCNPEEERMKVWQELYKINPRTANY